MNRKPTGNKSSATGAGTVRISARTGKPSKSARGPAKRESRSRAVAMAAASARPMKIKNSRARKEGGNGPSSTIKRKLVRALLLVVFFSAVGAGLGAGARRLWSWMTTSPRFAIREIVIRTGERVTESEIKTLGDLYEGDNILAFRLADCVEGMEIHPWVAHASVMRQFPDRVVIEVVERRPVAVISLGSLYYVDDGAEIFKKVLPGEPIDYPVFLGLSLRDVVEDKDEVDSLLRLGLEIIAVSKQGGLLTTDDISEVRLHRTYGASVVRASDAMVIRFGRGRIADKWSRLELALKELGDDAKKVRELDLNYESRVTLKLKEGYRVASAEAESAPGGF